MKGKAKSMLENEIEFHAFSHSERSFCHSEGAFFAAAVVSHPFF